MSLVFCVRPSKYCVTALDHRIRRVTRTIEHTGRYVTPSDTAIMRAPEWLLFSAARIASAQQYALQSMFPGNTFLDHFSFWTSGDPTFGYVHFVDRETAEQHGMITVNANSTAWGVDTTQVLDGNANLGRLSLRLTSLQSWTHGLFILDLQHMPKQQCGTWPAFWSTGADVQWPRGGETCTP